MATLTLTRGNDRTFRVTALDADSSPADLTGAHLWFTAKVSQDDLDADALISKETGNGVEVQAPPTDGIALVTLVPADTADLPSRAGRRGLVLHWDLKVKDGDDKITTLAKGLLVVVADVTRTSTP